MRWAREFLLFTKVPRSEKCVLDSFSMEMFSVGGNDRGFIHGAGAGAMMLCIIEYRKKQKGKVITYPTPPLSHSPIPPSPPIPLPSHKQPSYHLPTPSTQQTAPPPIPPLSPTPPASPQTNPQQTHKTSTKKRERGRTKKARNHPPIRRGKRKRNETMR